MVRLGGISIFIGKFLFIGACLLLPLSVHAATVTWDGGGADGKWETGANWDSDLVPRAGDDAVIDNATVTLSMGSVADFATLILGQGTNATGLILFGSIGTGGDITIANNATLTQANSAVQTITGTLTINSGGTLTSAANTAAVSNVVNVSATTITINPGGSINVSGKGYSGKTGVGNGPGGGQIAGWGGGGGGHVGDGGVGYGGALGGVGGYCSLTDPETMGSAGGEGASGIGRSGGGLIKLNVSGTLTINGSISAAGDPVSDNWEGAGAGGGINIVAGTIAGTPTSFTVAGGSNTSNRGGGGGGGCAYLQYTTANSLLSSQVVLAGGTGYNRAGSGALMIRQAGGNMDIYLKNGGAGAVSSFDPTGLSPNSITLNTYANYNIASGKTLTLPAGAHILGDGTGGITVAGTIDASLISNLTGVINVVSGGTINNTSNIMIPSGSGLTISSGGTILNAITNLSASGTLNLSRLATTAGITNLTIDGGVTTLTDYTTSTPLLLTSLTINSGGTLTSAANTAAITSVVNVSATTITINPGGSINVSGKGYSGKSGAGNGPAGGQPNVGAGGGGGGHVGDGGVAYNGALGGVGGYCSLSDPETMGSAGGEGNNGNGGPGGGLIKLNVSGTLTINGLISAAGKPSDDNWEGAGAGGGINIVAGTIAGTPSSFTVAGGSNSSNRGGGGGGGCAYLQYTTANSLLSSQVVLAGGTGVGRGGSGALIIKRAGGSGSMDIYLKNGGAGAASSFDPTGLFPNSITLNTYANYNIPSGKTLTLPAGAQLLGDGTGAITVKGTIDASLISNLSAPINVASGGTINNTSNIMIPSGSSLTISSGATVLNAITNLSASGTLNLSRLATTAGITNLTIDGGVTTLTDYTTSTPLLLTSLTINSGGTLTSAANTAAITSVVNVSATTIDINPGGSISVSGKGYSGKVGAGNGPAGGQPNAYGGGGGGGHVGDGGAGAFGGGFGGVGGYCSLSDPETIGSAGGEGNSGNGAPGGGLIKLNVSGTLTINGLISAAGASGIGDWEGGGAGGGVNIVADTIVGTPTSFTVAGGSSPYRGGGGGGGCIHLGYYNTNSILSGVVAGGTGNAAGTAGSFSEAGFISITAPTSPVLGTPTSASVPFSWTSGEGTETLFGVEKSSDGGSSFSGVATINVPTVDYTFTGLLPNYQYQFRVAAGDGSSTSTYATSSLIYTLANQTSAPTLGTATTSTIPLYINANGNPVDTTYAVYDATDSRYFTSLGILTDVPTFFTSSSWSGITRGLTASSNYTFQVIAKNGDGVNSATSTDASVTTVNAAVLLSKTTVATVEAGATDSYTIVLNAQPTSTVSVIVSPDSNQTVSTSTIAFTTSNWNVPVTVMVTAVNDLIAQGTHTGIITHTVANPGGVFNGIAVSSVTNTITDNDTAGVTIDPTVIITTEGGSTATYTVVLTSQPTSTVQILVSPDSASTVSTSTIAFTASNWNVPVTVTVTAVNDLIAQGTHVSTITHTVSSSGTGYSASLVISNFTNTIIDNDIAGVTISPTSIATTEGGSTATYTVVLTSQPTSTVQIIVSPDSASTVSTSTIAFTTANWNTPVTVTVTAVNDLIAQGTHTSSITHTASSSGNGYNASTVISSVTNTITDNDTAGVTISPTSVATTEGGSTATYTVVLTSEPTSTVQVIVSPDSASTVSTSTIAFTTANWNTPVTVTVTAVNDLVAQGTHTGTITHTVANPGGVFNGIAVSSVTNTITDNDTAGVTISPTSIATTEGGATDTYTVVLTSQPTSTVQIIVSPDSASTVSTSTIAFSTSNWNTPVTVTVTAVNDLIAQGTHTGTITHTVANPGGVFNGIAVSSVTNTITDNDTVGVIISPTSIATTEGGATDTYTVVLTSQPTSTVQIIVSPDSASTVSTSTISFNSTNWNAPVTVTVTAVNDLIAQGTHTGTITHTVANPGGVFNGIAVSSVTNTITDNDTVGVTISPTSIATTEGGATDTYTVVLTSQPTSTVQVIVSPDSASTVSTSTIAFSTSNWNTPVTVTVTAVNDLIAQGTRTSSIAHTASSSGNGYKASLVISSVTNTITDNDTAGVNLSKTIVYTNEGISNDSYTIVLNSSPTSTVQILVSPDTNETVSTSTINFTSANWNTPVTVTVTAVVKNQGDHIGTITHTASSLSMGYSNITVSSVTNSIIGITAGTGGGGGSASANQSAPLPGQQLLSIVLDHVEYINSEQAKIWIKLNADPATVRGYAISTDPALSNTSLIDYASLVSITVPATSNLVTIYVYVQYYSTTGQPSGIFSLQVDLSNSNIVVPPPPIETPPPAQAPAQTLDPSNLQSLLDNLSLPRNVEMEDLVLKQVRADAKEFKLVLNAEQEMTIRNFIVYGISPATIKLGQGERRAVVRDYMETVHRAGFVWSDVERLTTGLIPLTRNLALERQNVKTALPVFIDIFSHAPNFKVAKENFAWNTLLYRIRFPRDLVKERAGLKAFYAMYKHYPTTPFGWSVVRVLGYVK